MWELYGLMIDQSLVVDLPRTQEVLQPSPLYKSFIILRMAREERYYYCSAVSNCWELSISCLEVNVLLNAPSKNHVFLKVWDNT